MKIWLKILAAAILSLAFASASMADTASSTTDSGSSSSGSTSGDGSSSGSTNGKSVQLPAIAVCALKNVYLQQCEGGVSFQEGRKRGCGAIAEMIARGEPCTTITQ